MTDSAKVIYNMKEVRSNSARSAGPLGLTSSNTETSSPPLSPSEKELQVEKEIESCRGIRREIVRSRPEIDLTSISYMRLSLLTPTAAEHDGQTFTRLAINMDVSFNNSPTFHKFKWRVTNKRSEYYANLPSGWETDLALGSAWEFYNNCTQTRWIGKACYRMSRRESAQKMKLAPLTAIVVYGEGEDINYRLWIENAEVDGRFNIPSPSRYFAFASEPIRSFRPSASAIIQL